MNSYNVKQLKKLCKNLYGSDHKIIKKEDMIECCKSFFKKYKKANKIGSGKDCIVYNYVDKDEPNVKKEFALKVYRKSKDKQEILNEIKNQIKCSNISLSPYIYNLFSIGNKTAVVMEKLPELFTTNVVKNKGIITLKKQKEIIKLYNNLDKIGLYQSDPNLLNLMYGDDKKLKMIDFGMVKKIDKKLVKSLGSSKPNIKYCLLSMIINLNKVNCPCEYLERYYENFVVNQN